MADCQDSGTAVVHADHSCVEAMPENSGGPVLAFVDSALSKREGSTNSASAAVARSCLFARSTTMPCRNDSQPREASVRQDDIPHVLKCMSDMNVFSGGDAAGEAAGDTANVTQQQRERDHSAVVFDVDSLRAAFTAVRHAFPPHWRHCLAIKSCPLAFVIEEALDAGLGIEAASLVELYMALAHGCPADMVAFDSPAKTHEELELALSQGVLVNANSFDELDRIDTILRRKEAAPGANASATTARVGIRFNPLVGAGTISELSVSVPTSKFGVPATLSNIRAAVEAFRKWPWLIALHAHVGSQGCSLDQLTEGVATLCSIADTVDGEVGKGRVTLLDIGGGLPANYDSDEVSPSFNEYATALRKSAPTLFENTQRTVMTEFGRALVAKSALTVSVVEYVRHNVPEQSPAEEEERDATDTPPRRKPTKDGSFADASDDEARKSPMSTIHQTLVTHVGADLFVRASYCPGKYCHRLSMHGRTGKSLGGTFVLTDVAGPLCFQGDYVTRGSSLPRAASGDLVVVRDTGANTLSLFSRHCSRRLTAVYGYARDGDGQLCVRLVKEKESVRDVARFWGAR